MIVSGNSSNGIINNSPMSMGGGSSGGQGPMLGGGKGSTQVTIPKDVRIHNSVVGCTHFNWQFISMLCYLNTILKECLCVKVKFMEHGQIYINTCKAPCSQIKLG